MNARPSLRYLEAGAVAISSLPVPIPEEHLVASRLQMCPTKCLGHGTITVSRTAMPEWWWSGSRSSATCSPSCLTTLPTLTGPLRRPYCSTSSADYRAQALRYPDLPTNHGIAAGAPSPPPPLPPLPLLQDDTPVSVVWSLRWRSAPPCYLFTSPFTPVNTSSPPAMQPAAAVS